MISNFFSYRTFLTFTLLVVIALPLTGAKEAHEVKKRQIGVLARTGVLPQGKRSVEVLARDGELPTRSTVNKEAKNDYILDLLIKELGTAEGLSILRLQALAERLLEEKDGAGAEKRSVAALARNGELPQKRLTETGARAGYLIRPPQETVQPPADLLDPDDFLAGGRSSKPFGYWGKRNVGAAKNFLLESTKRSLSSARNFLFSKNGSPDLRKALQDKRSVAFAEGAAYPSPDAPNIFDYDDFHGDEKKNLGASKNFGKREDIQEKWSDWSEDKYNRMAGARTRKKRDLRWESSQQEQQQEQEDEEESIPLLQDLLPNDYQSYSPQLFIKEKRFLGRIPQLGRIHQKVKSPSTRRRPHLRPNWL